MVDRPGITLPEIAETYGRTYATVRQQWTRHPDWPAPTGKRGRFGEYDPKAVAAWVTAHADRDQDAPIFTRDPAGLLTVAEIADESGLSHRTVRADLSRGRLLPAEGDTVRDGVKLWRRGTIAAQLRKRRGYRRSE
jgi:predicted transcriptional regulator